MTLRWTAQTPLTIALAVSAVGVLACIALVALDRRRLPAAAHSPPRFALGQPPVPRRVRWIAAVIWVVASALLVGPGWGVVAAFAAAVLVVWLGRPRLAGVVTIAVLVVMGAVVVRVVQTERPLPDAGWPARFEWLHPLGAFAAVSLLITIVSAAIPGRRRSDR